MPRTPRYDIISIGDASMDAFVGIHDASLLCNLNKESCFLCLNFSEKIPMESLHFAVGGNACNNAVGSVRLGLKAALYSIIGEDDTGRRISRQLKDESVSTEFLQVQKGSASNYSVVLNHKAERTILVYHQPRTYRLPRIISTQWVYLTSLGKSFRQVHTQLGQQVKQAGLRLAFNPGTHQLLAGTRALKPILELTTVLIVNKEESETLLGKNHESIEHYLRELYRLGPQMVVITDGSHGAYGYDGKKIYRAKPLPAKPLEMTGAGDSFSTGLLAAVQYGKTLQDALLWGSANAASVIEHIGPQEGLLSKAQIARRLARKH